MKSRLTALAAVAAALAVVPAVALGTSGGASRAATNSQTFPDSIGEDANAPDITATTVTNDDAGNITFHLAVSNRPALTDDMLFLVFLDTDQNGATGDPQSFGADYVLQLVPGEVDLFHWNGSDFVGAQAPSLTFAYDATGPTFNVKALDLGATKGFNFASIAISGIVNDASGNPDFTNSHADSSPDPGHGTFTYQVIQKITLSVVAFTTTPKPAHAGRLFSVGLAANESDTAAGVTSGTVTCAATIAGKPLRIKTKALAGGVAACIWAIPKTAHGKTIRGTITLSAQGATVSRPFAVRIV